MQTASSCTSSSTPSSPATSASSHWTGIPVVASGSGWKHTDVLMVCLGFFWINLWLKSSFQDMLDLWLNWDKNFIKLNGYKMSKAMKWLNAAGERVWSGFSCVSASDVVGFDGSSSLLYSLSPWRKPATADSISLKFKTLRNSGVLLHMAGQSENGLSLQLHGGKLLLLLQKGALTQHLLHIWFNSFRINLCRAKRSSTTLHFQCTQFSVACSCLLFWSLRALSESFLPCEPFSSSYQNALSKQKYRYRYKIL